MKLPYIKYPVRVSGQSGGFPDYTQVQCTYRRGKPGVCYWKEWWGRNILQWTAPTECVLQFVRSVVWDITSCLTGEWIPCRPGNARYNQSKKQQEDEWNNKIGTYRFVAEPFHVDFKSDVWRWGYWHHLLNCAGCQWPWFWDCNPERMRIIILGYFCPHELDEMPTSMRIQRSDMGRENVPSFTDRNFAVINKDGNVVPWEDRIARSMGKW